MTSIKGSKIIKIFALSMFVFLFSAINVWSEQIEKPKGFPKKAIEFVVPMGPGGGSDMTARLLAKIAGEMIGQPITVTNREGGSGQLGLAYVLSQPNDGHTLLGLFNDFLIREAAVPEKYPFTKQVDLLCRLNGAPGTLQVRYDDDRFKTFNDVLNYAKKNPGKLKVVGSGVGSINHLVISQLTSATGIKLGYLPSNKSGERKSLLLGGHVDLMYEFLGTTLSLLENKKTRMLFILHDDRLPQFPEVPTAKELGYELTGLWRGIAVKKGTPEDIVSYLDKIYYAAMQTTEFAEYNKKTVCFNMYLNHEDFTRQAYNEIKALRPIVEEIGLKEKLK